MRVRLLRPKMFNRENSEYCRVLTGCKVGIDTIRIMRSTGEIFYVAYYQGFRALLKEHEFRFIGSYGNFVKLEVIEDV